jgi:hypothetical protein
MGGISDDALAQVSEFPRSRMASDGRTEPDERPGSTRCSRSAFSKTTIPSRSGLTHPSLTLLTLLFGNFEKLPVKAVLASGLQNRCNSADGDPDWPRSLATGHAALKGSS